MVWADRAEVSMGQSWLALPNLDTSSLTALCSRFSLRSDSCKRPSTSIRNCTMNVMPPIKTVIVRDQIRGWFVSSVSV